MRSETPQSIHLKDYKEPDFFAKTVRLVFDIGEDTTLLTATVHYERNPRAPKADSLRLEGNELKLVSVKRDGAALPLLDLDFSSEHLVVPVQKDAFDLEVVTSLRPQDNTALEGLYKSGNKFCTQCEPEGFRRMTYFLDRPDVMAVYETTIIADKKKYPILLSNGNLTAKGDRENGRHFATWQDPFPKPSYLFALVAGDLVGIEDQFVTRSGRKVKLVIYVESWNTQKCGHAMQSLKSAMKWDEEVFGLEYDLDIFMIVAVSDFNMGAMENKGLNIFNAKYILADANSATDADYEGILSVVGHEYFHNWTGNRVTCRDWFQLCLKEGLTVYRDQEFSSDLTSRPVVRIENVAHLRSAQFPEDSSPLAHPVRPETYIEINNFYTPTVYEKGAEVIRMLAEIVGKVHFRKGMDLYFKRHDGQAVTIEDFLKAMGDAAGMDLSQFQLWYKQAGTPLVTVTEKYDAKALTYTLTVTQKVPDTPGQTGKKPHLMPMRMALFGQSGKTLPLRLQGEKVESTERTLLLNESSHVFTFENVAERPVPSLFRGFSAPVVMTMSQSDEDLRFLMSHDTDGFNRYEAGQKLAINTIQKLAREGLNKAACQTYSQAFGDLLRDQHTDRRLLALAMSMPGLEYLINLEGQNADLDALFAAQEFLCRTLAEEHRLALKAIYDAHHDRSYSADAKAVGRRALKNACLGYLATLKSPAEIALATDQYLKTDNMTDTMAAISGVIDIDCNERESLLSDFYKKWKDDALVLNKWFAQQAGSRHPDVLKHVQKLVSHPDFDYLNPNRVYALLVWFGRSNNPHGFHHLNGKGYELLADMVMKIDPKNPQVASRVVTPLTQFRRYKGKRQELMKKELQRILKLPGLSKDVYEKVAKALT